MEKDTSDRHRATTESDRKPYCQQFEPLLAAFVEGALSPRLTLWAQEHIQECGACRRRSEAFRRFLLEEVEEPEISAE